MLTTENMNLLYRIRNRFWYSKYYVEGTEYHFYDVSLSFLYRNSKK